MDDRWAWDGKARTIPGYISGIYCQLGSDYILPIPPFTFEPKKKKQFKKKSARFRVHQSQLGLGGFTGYHRIALQSSAVLCVAGQQ